MRDAVKATWDFLINRKRAYHNVFDKEKPSTRKVLVDLAKFCRAHDTTFCEDARQSALMEGRREVWLRIQHHLQLSDDELWDIYTNGHKRD